MCPESLSWANKGSVTLRGGLFKNSVFFELIACYPFSLEHEKLKALFLMLYILTTNKG